MSVYCDAFPSERLAVGATRRGVGDETAPGATSKVGYFMKFIGNERDLMRQGQQNRRGRGRNHNQNQNPNQGHGGHNHNHGRKPQHQLSKSYESSGPDVKIRGTAQHIAEKYMHLARDAASAGDFIIAENYLQHAEHYNRIIMAAQAAQPQQPQHHNQNGPAQQPYPSTAEQPLHVNGNGGQRVYDERPASPPNGNGFDTSEDALPGFLTQPTPFADNPVKRADRQERPDRPERDDRDAAPRARRRRRPAGGPEGRMPEKANGHAEGGAEGLDDAAD
ncbi:MAG: DUF4167 domain-containing protein [Hyphomicrobiales bacterium]|nr:DUF4167 domain-containing protein [Hyphomicrobiales bacterium]